MQRVFSGRKLPQEPLRWGERRYRILWHIGFGNRRKNIWKREVQGMMMTVLLIFYDMTDILSLCTFTDQSFSRRTSSWFPLALLGPLLISMQSHLSEHVLFTAVTPLHLKSHKLIHKNYLIPSGSPELPPSLLLSCSDSITIPHHLNLVIILNSSCFSCCSGF